MLIKDFLWKFIDNCQKASIFKPVRLTKLSRWVRLSQEDASVPRFKFMQPPARGIQYTVRGVTFEFFGLMEA